MCQNKTLQKKMVNLYEEKIATIPMGLYAEDITDEREKAKYPIPIIERDLFKKVIQQKFTDLRFRNIDGLISIDDFAVKVEKELKKRKAFFKEALKNIREVSQHPEYTFRSILYAEFKPKHTSGTKRLSDEANYFIKCQKVYNALSAKMYTKVVYHPTAPALAKVHNLYELIDLYYRKGRF